MYIKYIQCLCQSRFSTAHYARLVLFSLYTLRTDHAQKTASILVEEL
jgi:hypothetical protein